MRSLALIALTGCRSILGIEDVEVGSLVEDALADSSNSDANPADASFGCPFGFVALPNSGSRGHRYKLINTPGSWPAQRDACMLAQGFLAFPDGNQANAMMELAAIIALTGSTTWIGLNDILVEGSYRTSLNMPISNVTRSLVTASGNPALDCVYAPTQTEMNEEDCAKLNVAVCECVP